MMSMDTKELLIGKGFTEDEADSILDTINGSDLIDLINLLTGDSNKSQIIDFLNSQIYLESLFKSMGDFHHILPLDLNESLIGFSYKILPNGKNDEIMDFMEKYNIDFLINNENEFYLECDNNSKLSLLDDFLMNLTKGKSPIKKDVSMSKHIKEGIMGMSKIKSLGRLRELAGLPPAPEAEPFDDQSSGDNFDDIDIDDNDGFEDAGVPGDLPPIGDNNVVPVQNSPAMSSIQDAINNISSSLSDLKVSEYKQVVNQLTSLLNNARDTGRNFLGERAVYKKKVTESARSMDGEAIKVGDFVGFKSGIEQSGKVVAINNGMLTISVYDSETGERENVVQPARRCWLDN